MPSKTEEYLALAQRTANGLTRYWESWTDYLTTASRLYKYCFFDQRYAQKFFVQKASDQRLTNASRLCITEIATSMLLVCNKHN